MGARKARGRAWGNALGGWRKQKRASNGQFGNGKSISRSRKKTARKSSPKKAYSKKSSVASNPNKTAQKKKMSTKKKVAIGAGIVGVASVGVAVYNQKAYNQVYGEMHSLGGEYSHTDLGKGVDITHVRTVSRARINKSREAGHRALKARQQGHKIRAAAHMTTVKRVSLKPQLHEMGFISQDGKAAGFYTTEIRGNRMHAKDMYLDEASRGNKTVISQMSKHTKNIQGTQVNKGRKIVISKFRSEDSERVVRNQAKRLGKENVIVQKRYKADKSFVDNITKSMDEGWKQGLKGTVEKDLRPAIKDGYRGDSYKTQRQRAREDARKARQRAQSAAKKAAKKAGVVI